MLLPLKAMDILVAAGDDYAHDHPGEVSEVIASGSLGRKLCSYCAKACLQVRVKQLLQRSVQQVLKEEIITREKVNQLYAEFRDKVAATKITSDILGRHVLELSYWSIEMRQPIKSLDQEFDLCVGKEIKERGVHCGLERLGVERALRGTVPVLQGAVVAPCILEPLNNVRHEMSAFIDLLDEEITGEDILPHLSEQIVTWRSQDKSSA